MDKQGSNPVLLIGSGRSGTTFLAKLVDSAPNVFYLHEPDSLNVNDDIPFLPEPAELDQYVDQMRSYFGELLAERHWKTAATLPVFPKTFRNGMQHWLHRQIVQATKVPALNRLVPACIPDICDERADKTFVIKSVNSIGRVPLFLKAIPNLKIVHIVRHPCAVISSLQIGHQQGLMSNNVYLKSVFTMGDIDRFGYSREEMENSSWEECAAFQWMAMNQRVAASQGHPNYMQISYEALCMDVEAGTRRILDFCEIPWTDQTMQFIDHLEAKTGGGSRYFSVNRNPKSSLFKWKENLSAEAQDKIRAIITKSDIGRYCEEAIGTIQVNAAD